MSKRKIYSAIDAAAMVRRRKAHLPVSRQELCDYVTDFAYQFYLVADGNNDMRFLAYLLAMVVEEAVHQSDLADQSSSAAEGEGGDAAASDDETDASSEEN